MLIKSILLIPILFLSACIGVMNNNERKQNAIHISEKHSWISQSIKTDHFVIQAFLPTNLHHADTLNIYLEGDGLSWIKSTTPSDNPTPINPVALKLALLDTNSAVYLARPCQYVQKGHSKNCSQKYWTSHRFSIEVVESTQQAIDELKIKFGASKLILIGYSGGGTVAALVAARRSDVIKLVTVAGNLDHAYWTNKRHLSPLSGSLNSADFWMELQIIPQQHYVGSQDYIIDESVVRSYAGQFKIRDNIKISVLQDFDHQCCWESIWPSIVKSHFGNSKSKNP